MTGPAKPAKSTKSGKSGSKDLSWPLILVLFALGVYLVLFFHSRMPSLEGVLADQAGGPSVFRRAHFLIFLLCPDFLLEGWFGSPPEFGLGDRLPVLAIAGLILAIAALAGWMLMLAFRADRGLTRLEVFVFSTALGLNALSTYVLLVGLVGLLRYGLVFALPVVALLIAAGWLFFSRKASTPSPHLAGGLARCEKSIRSGGQARRLDEGDSGKGLVLSPHWLWLALPFVLIVLLGGALPPVDFDVREYHLQVPKEFYQQGRIGFLAHNVYGNMALGTEMLSLLAMVITGDWWLGALAGKTVIAAFAPLTGLALLAAGQRFFSRTVGIVAALVYLSIPWILHVSTAGLVEGAAACYLLLAVYAILLWHDEGPAPVGRLLLAGYLTGSAVATKYPAALFVFVPLTAWVVWQGRGDFRSLFALPRDPQASAARRGKPLAAPLLFVLAATVACGLWFGKNWVLTGNPTYPLLYQVFDGKTWTPEKDRQWNRVHLPHDFSPGRLASDLGRLGLTSEWLSPVVMPLAALAFLARKNRRLLLGLFGYSAYVIAVWWLFTHRIDRFWIPMLPIVALLAGAGACWNTSRWWRTALSVGLVLGLTISFLMASSAAPGKDNRYFVALDRLRNDPLRVDPWHRYFNAQAADGRLLLVGEAEVFDLEMPVLYNTCFDDSIFEQLVKDKAPAAIRAELAAQGISHVFVHWGEIARYRNSGYGFTDFVQPAVFDRLVVQGILKPLPVIDGHPGRGYEVVQDD